MTLKRLLAWLMIIVILGLFLWATFVGVPKLFSGETSQEVASIAKAKDGFNWREVAILSVLGVGIIGVLFFDKKKS